MWARAGSGGSSGLERRNIQIQVLGQTQEAYQVVGLRQSNNHVNFCYLPLARRQI